MSGITRDNFKFVRDLVCRESGISLNSDMEYLVESRMLSLVRKEELSSLDELFAILRGRENSSLATRVVEAMTTNETYFFRDSHPFDTLCQEVLPSLAEAHAGSLNIWCAACSTGQEPYTIAMAVSEQCPELLPRLKIHATDLSTDVLAKGRAGVYSRLDVSRGMPLPLLTKYFEQVDDNWQISQELRRLVNFDILNLSNDWAGLAQMDVIFLRNVLIYFEPEMKSSILQKCNSVLKPNGSLFLGASETILNLETSFERINAQRGCYYKGVN